VDGDQLLSREEAPQSALSYGSEARGAGAPVEPVGDGPSGPADRELRTAYQGSPGNRAEARARRRVMEGGRARVRRAGYSPRQIRLARRPGVLRGRFERRCGALSRPVRRHQEVAAHAGLAQSLLGAAGREAGARDAGTVRNCRFKKLQGQALNIETGPEARRQADVVYSR